MCQFSSNWLLAQPLAAVSWCSAKTIASRLTVGGVLEQDDVGLRARFACIGHVDRGFVYDWAHLLARSATDAQARVDVWALHLHGQHRRLFALFLILAVAFGYFGILRPNRLRGRRAELFAHDTRRRHGPGQAATLIVHRGADRDRFLTEPHLLLFGDLLDGARWANLSAQHTRKLTIADARDQDRRPQTFDASLEEGRMERVVRAHLHALGATDAALEEGSLFDCTRRTNHFLAVGFVRPIADTHTGDAHRAGGRGGH